MSKQDLITKKLDQKLEWLLDQYARRVRALNKKEAPKGTVSDIFIELNNIWVRDCNLAKRPLQKDQFALAVNKLNNLTEKVEKNIKFNYNLGRFLFWLVVALILLGIGVIAWCFYWLYMVHFQYVINF